MKPQTLPVKRRPVPKGIFKRLRAVTGSRKQRVAAAAAPEMESDDSSSKISRALTIIFLIHIVAIGLIFVHKRFLDGHSPDEPKSAKAGNQEKVEVASVLPRVEPRLSSGEKPFLVRQGDNYARIAATAGVDEGELRLINKHVDIRPGLLLRIPPKRAVVPAEAPEVVALQQHPTGVDDGEGLVPAVDVNAAPRAKLVRPNIPSSAETKATPVVASGKSYVVKSGDSVWRIANKFKVNQDALMKANGIADAGKLKVGMTLAIPR
ncbi:MAG: LysM peptidoglycan-binding domain-containing protein [Verrucomicrobiota bacterium]